jgi:hypothetical protein
VPDNCAGKTCQPGLLCDPATGECVLQPCTGITCQVGYLCSPTKATCLPDPCSLVRCDPGAECMVSLDDSAECRHPTPATTVGTPVVSKVKGGGLLTCSCRLGDRHPTSRLPWGIVGLGILGWFVIRRPR